MADVALGVITAPAGIGVPIDLDNLVGVLGVALDVIGRRAIGKDPLAVLELLAFLELLLECRIRNRRLSIVRSERRASESAAKPKPAAAINPKPNLFTRSPYSCIPRWMS